jgi:hypothetical protein
MPYKQITLIASHRSRFTAHRFAREASMLSNILLRELRIMAPIMDLLGITRQEWAQRAHVSPLTLNRYLYRFTRVGDSDDLQALLNECQTTIIISPDGPLSEAWTADMKKIIQPRLAEQD